MSSSYLHNVFFTFISSLLNLYLFYFFYISYLLFWSLKWYYVIYSINYVFFYLKLVLQLFLYFWYMIHEIVTARQVSHKVTVRAIYILRNTRIDYFKCVKRGLLIEEEVALNTVNQIWMPFDREAIKYFKFILAPYRNYAFYTCVF